jgi:hypothetical protein
MISIIISFVVGFGIGLFVGKNNASKVQELGVAGEAKIGEVVSEVKSK